MLFLRAFALSGTAVAGAERWTRLTDEDLGGDAVMRAAYPEYLDRANGAAKGSVNGILELGQFYQANAFGEEAVECYESVARTGSDEIARRARYLAACAMEELGEREAALESLQVIVEGRTVYAPARLRLARLLLGLGRADEAARWFEASRDDPATGAGAAIGLAKMDLRSRDFQKAEERLLNCLKQYPDCGDAALLLSNVYSAMGDEKAAEIYLRRGQGCPRHTSLVDPWLDELAHYRFGVYRLAIDADTLFTALRFEEARSVFERGLELYPASGELWLGLGKLEFAMDRREEAFSALERSVESPDPTAQAFSILGEELYRDGKYSEALELCSLADERGMEAARIERLRAKCWLGMGKRRQAQKVLEGAIERFPQDSAMLEALGDVARSEGELDRAREYYERALAVRPLELALHEKSFAVSIEQRDWLAAERRLKDLQLRFAAANSYSRLEGELWQARALEFQEQGKVGEWKSALLKAFASDSRNEERFKQLAAQLMGAKEWEAVLELVSLAPEGLAGSVVVLKIEGVAQLQLGRLEQGLDRLRAAYALATAQGELEEAQRLQSMIERLSGAGSSV